ncbi:hypothetical protein [Pontibacter pamirensis]|uniref:hypothetical protein n=1 Tax=Pontibacter pamirensis TaxID=2562824 RepID=UPI0013896B27|nr:hypothetical protein [Pontibacter pamirensis]
MRIFTEKNFFGECTLFVREWVKLLSENKLDEACDMLDDPEDNGRSIFWDAATMTEALLGYIGQRRMPSVSDPYRTDLGKERVSFIGCDEGNYAVDYDIPIEGEWTDLTAQFTFKRHASGLYLVLLEGLSVLN